MNHEFETSSDGLSDISMSALLKLSDRPGKNAHLILGTTIPNGDLDQRDQTPMSESALLAYPMQLGSGTWDPFIGLNYGGYSNQFIWGMQARYQHRLGKNKNEYALGNSLMATAWGAIKASETLDFSIRAGYKKVHGIDGSHPDMNPRMMPLFDAENSGSDRVILSGGMNWLPKMGSFEGVRVGLEGGYVVYENLIGNQMQQKFQWTLGLQYVFESGALTNN